MDLVNQTSLRSSGQPAPQDTLHGAGVQGRQRGGSVDGCNQHAPDAAADGAAEAPPGMRSGRGAACAGSLPVPQVADGQNPPHCRQLSLRIIAVAEGDAEASSTSPGSVAGGHSPALMPDLPKRHGNGAGGRALRRSDRADAGQAGSAAPEVVPSALRHGQDEFGLIARQAHIDGLQLEQQLAQVCQGRSTIVLVLSDFAAARHEQVLECLFRQPHWQTLQLDLGKRHHGWERCLPRLQELMSSLPCTNNRRVLLDFGHGSLTSTAAPAILQQQPDFLHGFDALRFSNMVLRGNVMSALVSALRAGPDEGNLAELDMAGRMAAVGAVGPGALPVDGQRVPDDDPGTDLYNDRDTVAGLRGLSLTQIYSDSRDLNLLFAALGRNVALARLALGCFPLRDSVAALAGALRRNRGIAHLSLTALRPDQAGMRLLLESVAQKPELASLDLSGNNIDEENLLLLACWLQGAGTDMADMPALKSLSLVDLRMQGDNYDDSFHDHARRLVWGEHGRNPWTPAVGIALATMLEKNQQLQVLNMNRNPLSIPATEALLGGLAGNTGLRELRIDGASVSREAVARLAGAMAARKSPLLLEVDSYRCADAALKELAVMAENFPDLHIEFCRQGILHQPGPLQKQVSQHDKVSSRR